MTYTQGCPTCGATEAEIAEALSQDGTADFYVACGCDFHGDHGGCNKECQRYSCTHKVGKVQSCNHTPLLFVKLDHLKSQKRAQRKDKIKRKDLMEAVDDLFGVIDPDETELEPETIRTAQAVHELLWHDDDSCCPDRELWLA